MEASQGRFSNRRVSSAFFLPLSFTALRATDEGNQTTVNVRPWQAGCGNRTGIFTQLSCLEGTNPCEGYGETCKTKKAEAPFFK